LGHASTIDGAREKAWASALSLPATTAIASYNRVTTAMMAAELTKPELTIDDALGTEEGTVSGPVARVNELDAQRMCIGVPLGTVPMLIVGKLWFYAAQFIPFV